MKLDLLYAHAADLGLDVEWTNLGPVRRGEYRHSKNLIRLHCGLTRAQATATLAHELGHATFGDRCSTVKSEQRAWEYGASLIITVKEYQHAERVVGHHPTAIATELAVTRKLIESWQDWYRRGGAVRLSGSPSPR